jgi:hypothetical protein
LALRLARCSLRLRTVNSQWVIAIATMVQDVLLLASAVLVAWYLYETRKMRRAAEAQVTESQALVKASREQLEAQAKPALIARLQQNSHVVELINIGSGPALHVEFMTVPRGSSKGENITGLGFDHIAFLEPKQTQLTHVRSREPDVPGTVFLDSSSRSLRCEYRSLSGCVYFSVFDFDHVGNFVEDTRFGKKD